MKLSKALGAIALPFCVVFFAAAQDEIVHFEFNSYQINASSQKVLDSISNLNNLHRYAIELVGHTDTVGSHKFNNILAQKRVNEVAEYLLNRGVVTKRMVTDSYGKTKTISNHQDLNRRVEIYLKKRVLTAAEKQYRTFQKEMLPKKQKHYISGTQGGKVKGKQGTTLIFPKNCFVTASGKTVKGKITVKLTEYIEMDEFIGAGLTTKSNGQLLSSAGMVKVSAYSGKTPLEIAPGKSFELQFNNTSPENYSTFYGQSKNGEVNWINADSTDNLFATSQKAKPIPKPNDYSIKFGNSINVDERYNMYSADSNELNMFVYYSDKKVRVTTYADRKKKIKWMSQEQADSARQALKVQRKIEQDSIALVQKAFQAIQSTQLGYINCDRYLREQNTLSMHLTAMIESNDAEVVTAGLVFYDINSYLMMPLGKDKIKYQMKIPKNSKPYLYVVAIKNEQPFWYFKEFVAHTEVNKKVKLTRTTFEEIKQVL